jgi:NADP-dependent 3-hydroxy acid dehydrogenase YdfG
MAILKGKVAWVTGGGSGIGQAGAVELARSGATVVVSGRRDSALAETESLIRGAGGAGETQVLDITDREAVARASAAILARHGRVDILVNCAGVNIPKRFFKDLATTEWDRVVDINLNGALYCTLAVLPLMRARRDGLVINIGSWFARYPGYVGGAAYNASKQALTAMTHQLNLEEGLHGIRACVIHPGETVTPMQRARPKPPSPEDQAKMLKMEDLGRVVRFVAESPAHVCLNEIVITPTWNRLILGGGEMLLAPRTDQER